MQLKKCRTIKKYIVAIQKELEQNDAGVRKQSGTNLKNAKTGEVIFTPPQTFETIEKLLINLEKYINEPNDIDPLVNRVIMHFQFETRVGYNILKGSERPILKAAALIAYEHHE